MKVITRIIFIFLTFHFSVPFTQAQTEDVVLKAMQDELMRNINELKSPNMEKPFFILYGLLDQKNYSISATLGSITQSSETPFRLRSSTRVLVGDYAFNDESLEDNLYSNGSAIELPLPMDDDYMGIRRSYWSATDKVYRDAARHFEKHKETLKETQKKLEEIPHRSFVKSNPVKIIQESAPLTFNKGEWETKARNLSAIFLQHPDILNSTVVIHFTTGYKYIVTSEGTTVKVPISLATFSMIAQTKNPKGEFAVEQIIHLAPSPDKLPSEEQLAGEIKKAIETIRAKSSESAPKMDEEYTGPVLLMGPAVADIFSTLLFKSKETILATDDISKLNGFQFNEGITSLDSKVGKTVYSDLMTMKAKPKLKSYNGIQLLGSYDVDDEGIEPAEELTVVDKGVLKALLNNRTITSPSQVANGFSSGPGVLEIKIAQQDSDKALKDKLIAKAKAEGLDYAIIIRDSPGAIMGLLKVYKVSVIDGSEVPIHNAFLNSTARSLKKIMGASGKYNAYNTGAINARGPGAGPGTGMTSFIVPEAVLLEELEIRPFSMPTLTEEDYVSNPLKSSKK